MDHWPFIIAAYGLTVAGTLALALMSFLAMRGGERRAAQLRESDRP